MRRSLALMLLWLPLAAPAFSDDRTEIVGSWKVQSFHVEFQDNGERRNQLGENPNGFIVFLPQGRMMAYLEASGRKTPRTDEERAAAYRSLVAYSGKYRIEGNRGIAKVDASWNPAWIGTDQERFFKLDADTLHVTAQWNPSPLYENRMVRAHVLF